MLFAHTTFNNVTVPRRQPAVRQCIRARDGCAGEPQDTRFQCGCRRRAEGSVKWRDNDSAGLAVGYANISSSASAFDRDVAAFTTPGYPERTAETVLEATYQYQVTPWW
jgi:porin